MCSARRFVLFLLVLGFADSQHEVSVQSDCFDCNDPLQSAIDECSAFTEANSGVWCTVHLAAGTFAMPAKGPIGVYGVSNIVVRGAGDGDGGTRLLLSGDAKQMKLWEVTGATNVTLAGFAIDMQRPSFTLCTADAHDGSATLCSFDADRYEFQEGAAAQWQYVAQQFLEFDPVSRHTPAGGDDIWPPTDVKITIPSPGVMRMDPSHLGIGKQYIVRHLTYGPPAFPITDSRDVTLEDVTMWSGPGMGVVAHGNTGVTLRRFHTRRKGDAPMSISADSTHFTSSRGGLLTLDSCVFEGQGDDGVNINTMYGAIDSISSDRRTVTLTGRFGTSSGVPDFRPGDGVQVFDRYSFNARAAGSALSSTKGTLTLSDALPSSVQLYDLVQNVDSQSDAVLMVNCSFVKNRARGALLKANNVLATGNTFDHTSGPCIQAYPDGCHWYEGNTFSNWTLEGNSFSGCNFAAGANDADIFVAAQVPSVHASPPNCDRDGSTKSTAEAFRDLTLRNNTWNMEHSGQAFTAYGVVGLKVDGNVVLTPAPPPSSPWSCVQATSACSNSWVPLRCQAGVKECMATDGKSCRWHGSRTQCEGVVADPPPGIPFHTGVFPGNCVSLSCGSGELESMARTTANFACHGCLDAQFTRNTCDAGECVVDLGEDAAIAFV